MAGELAPAERPPITANLTPAAMAKVKQHFAPTADDSDIYYFATVARHLAVDPWAGHIVLAQYGGLWRPQLTVAGRRYIAQRTGRLRGIVGPEWCGPRRYDADGGRLPLEWLEVWDVDDDYPYAARCLVRVDGWDTPANGTVKWSEFSQWTTKRVNGRDTPALRYAWAQMPSHMLGKVAESLALRRAFAEVEAAVSYVGVEADEDVQLVAEAEADTPAPSLESGPPASTSGRGEASTPAPASHSPRSADRGSWDADRVPDHVYDALPEATGRG